MSPIYEYDCPQCNKKFEEIKGIDDRIFALCPECDSSCKLVPSVFDFKLYNPFTKDGAGFTSDVVHPEAFKEMQAENRRK